MSDSVKILTTNLGFSTMSSVIASATKDNWKLLD